MFTTDPRVIDIGVGLLAIAAAFQLFDGTQAVATGALRGISETRMPMIVNVIGHWFLGLPVGYALASVRMGREGLWIGLSIGLDRDRARPDRRLVEKSLRSCNADAECRMQMNSLHPEVESRAISALQIM